MIRIAALILPMLITACSNTINRKIDFAPNARLKVAVLPLVMVNDRGEINEVEEGRLLIDNLSLNTNVDETATQIVRRMVLTTLLGTNLRLISKDLIDVDLPHAGFSLPQNKLNYKKLYESSASSLCKELLGCDAVLYGKVIRWSRAYYGIEAVHEVALEFTLVSAKDNKVIFSAQGSDYDSRGLSKGPTGISSVITGPIQGLDKKITEDLTRNLIQRIFEPLAKMRDKPTDIDITPPAIFAASYFTGDKIVTEKNPLDVLVMATPKSFISAKIKGTKIEIPLIERSPSHYSGKFYPLNTDTFGSNVLSVSIEDKYGQTLSLDLEGADIKSIK